MTRMEGRGREGREEGLIGVRLRKYCIKEMGWPGRGWGWEKKYFKGSCPKRVDDILRGAVTLDATIWFFFSVKVYCDVPMIWNLLNSFKYLKS